MPRPVKELKAFKRINLKPGESKEIRFDLTINDLSFWNNENKFVAEPGKFDVMVGNSSDDGDLLRDSFELVAK